MPDMASETVPFLSPAEVGTRASEVLKAHKLTTIPIDPVVLANRAGIKVNNAKFADANVVGMIVKRDDEVVMLINRDDPPFRKRFTIAHELGHYYLHLMEDGEFIDREANLFRQLAGPDEQTTARQLEIQANMVAAALLMPAIEVRRYWAERPSIEELATIFKVSKEAMGYRIVSLDLD